jgi:hypothetical protein
MHFGLVAPLGVTSSPRLGALRAGVCRLGFFGSGLLGTLLTLAGCASTDEKPPAAGNLLLTDANNYQSTSALSIGVVPTAPAVDLQVCFDEALKDIQCHDLVPSVDIDNVALLRFKNATPEQVQQKLVQSQLLSTDYDVYRDINTVDGETCVQTANMEFFGSPINLAEDYKESATDTYMLVFTRGTDPGIGSLTMMFVKPTAGETNTMVTAPTGCSADETMGMLDFTADLKETAPLQVPVGAAAPGALVVDWSDVSKDGGGGDVRASIIDRALIGYYEGKTVADLEAGIFDLETMATTMWEMPIAEGSTADLSQAIDLTTQMPFPGFTQTTGVWILALMCSTCQNPSPTILTVVQPI